MATSTETTLIRGSGPNGVGTAPCAIAGNACGLLPCGYRWRISSRITMPSATVATSGIMAGALRKRLITSRSRATPSPPTAAMATRQARPSTSQGAEPPSAAARACTAARAMKGATMATSPWEK